MNSDEPQLWVSRSPASGPDPKNGQTGTITLNRPRALNALTYDMIKVMAKTLSDWKSDPDIRAVVIKGSGDRAFCAGGDVKQVYLAGKEGKTGGPGNLTFDFFADEYRLNAEIAAYPKPVISLWDGIVMGGGAGISVMGSHRIATEKTKFGMPETAIGFFPDVGGSYFLSRLGPVGTMMALTGQTVGTAEALALGLATHFVPSANLELFLDHIRTGGLDRALALAADAPPPPETGPETGPETTENRNGQTAAHFDKATVEDIIASLETDSSPFAQKTLATLKSRSPTALKITLRQLQLGKDMRFNACLNMEFRMCRQALQGHDFYEGVRAVLIDKDHKPKWSPPDPESVRDECVDRYFRISGDSELNLPES